MIEKDKQKKLSILAAFTLLSISIIYLFPPLPQWPSYHQFADVREVWGIPNFWNVISNAPFFLVGILGFLAIKDAWKAGNFTSWQEATPFYVIFLGLMLTAAGSTYYHLAPDNNSLAWDRAPMTLVFMAFVSLVIMERIHSKFGLWLLMFFIAFGITSVCYWIWTESLGRGDLRLYIFAKFYALTLTLAILYLFPKSYPSLRSVLFVIVFYGIATICELNDTQIYQISEGTISGHTLKHLFGAIASYGFVMMVNELKTLRRSTLL